MLDRIGEHPGVAITYFPPDEKKAGGVYVTVTGNVKKTDAYERSMGLADIRL